MAVVWLRAMQDILSQFTDRVEPAHTAVVVVDMQNDFCAAGGHIDRKFGCDQAANEALADRIAALVGAGRARGAPIVWVQAIYDDKYVPPAMLAKAAERGDTGPRCAEGSWGADFYRLAPADGDIMIRKHCYSAFQGTPLDGLLRRRGVRTLVVTGVSTNICVESTFRDGHSRGYYIVVPADCVAAPAADLHAATLQNVETLIGDVTAAEDLIRLWTAAAGALQKSG